MLQPFLHTDQDFLEIGIDEAGRGPLFGRLYTAGVVLPKTTGVVLPKTTELVLPKTTELVLPKTTELVLPKTTELVLPKTTELVLPKTTIDLGLPKSMSTDEKKTKEINWTCIKDSKKIKSHKKIKACAEFIKENALAYSVQFVEHTTIDQINIRQAVFRGMHACIHEIREKLDQTKQTKQQNPNPNSFFLLIDGNDFKPYAMFDETTQKLEYLPYQTIEKGDNTYLAIAAASILAKCARDEYMLELCEQRPELKEKYGMHTNMGYGTKKHIEGIKQYGLVEGHRLSFHIK